MKLGDRVSVSLDITGIVIGRTYEEDPKVDLQTPWGVLNGIPESVLEFSEQLGQFMVPRDELPPNVTRIRG